MRELSRHDEERVRAAVDLLDKIAQLGERRMLVIPADVLALALAAAALLGALGAIGATRWLT